jgi:hypothetical protein
MKQLQSLTYETRHKVENHLNRRVFSHFWVPSSPFLVAKTSVMKVLKYYCQIAFYSVLWVAKNQVLRTTDLDSKADKRSLKKELVDKRFECKTNGL